MKEFSHSSYVCKNPGHAKIHAMLDDILNEGAEAIRVGIIANIVFMRGRLRPGEQLPEGLDELQELTSIPEPTISVKRSGK